MSPDREPVPRARLRPKAQLTFPEEIRQILHVNEGDEVEFTVEGEGELPSAATSQFRQTRRGSSLRNCSLVSAKWRMATFETLPRFEEGWATLTQEQQAMFRRLVREAFEPDPSLPDRPFVLP